MTYLGSSPGVEERREEISFGLNSPPGTKGYSTGSYDTNSGSGDYYAPSSNDYGTSSSYDSSSYPTQSSDGSYSIGGDTSGSSGDSYSTNGGSGSTNDYQYNYNSNSNGYINNDQYYEMHPEALTFDDAY